MKKLLVIAVGVLAVAGSSTAALLNWNPVSQLTDLPLAAAFGLLPESSVYLAIGVALVSVPFLTRRSKR